MLTLCLPVAGIHEEAVAIGEEGEGWWEEKGRGGLNVEQVNCLHHDLSSPHLVSLPFSNNPGHEKLLHVVVLAYICSRG